MANKHGIFISYRRTDSGGYALALYRELSQRFGHDAIFFDRKSIEPGANFPLELKDAVEGCLVLLAVIGPDWQEAKDRHGRYRLQDPCDFVRHEIVLALAEQKQVIPVLVGDSSMPSDDILPNELKPLAAAQAVKYGYEYDGQFKELVETLRKAGIRESMTENRPVPAERVPRSYVERLEVSGPLLAALTDPVPADKWGETRIIAIHGIGGTGKTTIASWLAWHPATVARFPDGCLWIRLGRECRQNPIVIVKDWLAKLNQSDRQPTTIEAASTDFAAVLQNRGVLIVIDDVWPQTKSIAKDLIVPAPRCRFLLTTRFADLATEFEAYLFSLDALTQVQALELLSRKLGRALTNEEQISAERLACIVGRHPFALELAAVRILNRKTWDDLIDALSSEVARLESLDAPPSLLRHHEDSDEQTSRRRSLRRSLLLSIEELADHAQHLFAWLGVLADHSGISPACGANLWSLDPADADTVLNSFHNLGIVQFRDGVYYLHDLMHDVARGILTSPTTALDVDGVKGLGLTFEEASRHLLSRYRATTRDGLWHTVADDGYILDHLVWQLDKAGWRDEMEKLFWEATEDGHCAWQDLHDRQGRTNAFFSDLLYALQVAEVDLSRASNAGTRAVALARHIHYSLLHASLISQSARVPNWLLAAALEHSVITWRRALALARRHPDATARARLLETIAAWAPEEERAAIAKESELSQPEVTSQSGPSKESSPDSGESPGERIAKLIRALESLTQDQRTQVISEARTLAESIASPTRRTEALLTIAKAMSDAERQPILEQALATVNSAFDDDPRRPQDVKLEEFAAGSWNPAWREQLLLEIYVMMPEDRWRSILGRILEKARAHPNAEERGVMLWEACGAIPDRTTVRAILKQEFDSELAVGDGLEVGNVLLYARKLVPFEVVEASARFLDENAIQVRPQSLIDEYQISHQAETGRPLQRAQAWLEAARRAEDHNRSKLLAPALDAVRSINSPERRAEMLALAASLMSDERRHGLFEEALDATHRIESPCQFVSSLAWLATMMPAERKQEMLAEAYAYARSQEGWVRTNALIAIAEHVEETERNALVAEVCGTSLGERRFSSNEGRVRLLGRIAALFHEPDRREFLDIALKIAPYAGDIPPQTWRLYVRFLAPLQTEAERAPWLGQIFRGARSLPDVETMDFLPDIVRLLPLDEALAAARSIENNPYLRAQALSVLGPRIAENASPTEAVAFWMEIMALLKGRKRSELLTCITTGLGPLISAIGDSSSPTSLARSVMTVAQWWP